MYEGMDTYTHRNNIFCQLYLLYMSEAAFTFLSSPAGSNLISSELIV